MIQASGMEGFSEEGAPGEWDFAVGEIYGYRWWVLNLSANFAGYTDLEPVPVNGKLIGANYQYWEAGRNTTACSLGTTLPPSWDDLLEGRVPAPHEPPETRVACGCGFWAYFDQYQEHTTHFGDRYLVPCGYRDTIQVPVFGVIKGTGKVIVGDRGFRCQYAEIVGLGLPEVTKQALSGGHRYADEDEIRALPARVRGDGAARTFRAMTGRKGSGDLEFRSERASEGEIDYRLATVKTMLEAAQPQAKIFSDLSALRQYFPPDKNYAPKS